ncbi:ABC transporter permease [Frondihabitans peucedani]|jgi:rhamnose transport system permease protein|uniref:Autoinducer 2 import system permease protein LsrD n=1 Tax=Frondihabitans peucedani TaxID=598626 RepID=A0ABP8E0V6_9MICO
MSDTKTRAEAAAAPATTPTPRRTGRRLLRSRDATIVYALVLIVILAAIFVPYFASVTTVSFLLIDAIPILLMAMPMALIIITGEIDLSVASTAGLSAALLGVLWHQSGSHGNIAVMFVICLIVGAACGAFNGFLIAVVGLPSLAVTIGTLALFRGLALVVIGDNAVADFPVSLTTFATSSIPGIGVPTVMVFVLVVVAVFAVILHFTPFGRALFALGYSTEAASFVGIRVNRSKFWLYVASGVISSAAGLFWVLRYSSAQSDSVQGLELSVVAAVLLGGVSIFGGSGSIVGVVAGVLIIRTVNYSLQLGGLPDTALTIVTGGLLVLSVVAPSVSARFVAARDRRARARLADAPAT